MPFDYFVDIVLGTSRSGLEKMTQNVTVVLQLALRAVLVLREFSVG